MFSIVIIASLQKWIKNEPDDNPLEKAAYWKQLLDEHIHEVIGCSLSRLRRDNKQVQKLLRECANVLDKVHRRTSKASRVAGVSSIAGGAMALGGLAAAPFTGGLSLSLTLGGAGVGAAGGVVSVSAVLLKHGWEKSKIEKAKKHSGDVVKKMKILEEFLTICIRKLDMAQEFLKAPAGRDYEKKLREAIKKGKNLKRDIAVDMVKFGKGFYGLGTATLSTIGVLEFIKSGTYARAGVQTALAIQKSSPGVEFAGKIWIMAGSVGAKALSATLGAVSIGLGVWEVVQATKNIEKGNEIASKMRTSASQLNTAYSELADVYYKLNR